MPQKRFIAGAVCPECKAVDKMVTYREGEIRYRECVACGFRDEMRFEVPPRELETRVNRSEEEKRAETQPVKIIDPQAK